MSKPLVIISHDDFFTQLERDLEEGIKAVEEEAKFCERKLNASKERNVGSVWDRAYKELIRRGTVPSDTVFGADKEKGKSLVINKGVLFIMGEEDRTPASCLMDLFGGLPK